jgi:hypothetical protein
MNVDDLREASPAERHLEQSTQILGCSDSPYLQPGVRRDAMRELMDLVCWALLIGLCWLAGKLTSWVIAALS